MSMAVGDSVSVEIGVIVVMLVCMVVIVLVRMVVLVRKQVGDWGMAVFFSCVVKAAPLKFLIAAEKLRSATLGIIPPFAK